MFSFPNTGHCIATLCIDRMFLLTWTLIVFMALPAVNAQTVQPRTETGTQQTVSVLPAIGFVASKLNKCASDLVSLFSGQYQDYLIILDATGKEVNGLGKYDECQSLENARYCLLELYSNYTEIDGTVLGICVPRSCDAIHLEKVGYAFTALLPPLLPLDYDLTQSSYGEYSPTTLPPWMV